MRARRKKEKERNKTEEEAREAGGEERERQTNRDGQRQTETETKTDETHGDRWREGKEECTGGACAPALTPFLTAATREFSRLSAYLSALYPRASRRENVKETHGHGQENKGAKVEKEGGREHGDGNPER